MFYENYVKLCNSIALSPNAVAKILGFSSGTVTWWKKGRAPRDTAIQKIADYFGVSVNYLLGADEKPLTPAFAGPNPATPARKKQRNLAYFRAFSFVFSFLRQKQSSALFWICFTLYVVKNVVKKKKNQRSPSKKYLSAECTKRTTRIVFQSKLP